MCFIQSEDVNGQEIEIQYLDSKGKIWVIGYNEKNNRYYLWTKMKTGKLQQQKTSNEIEKLINMMPDGKVK